MDRIAAIYPLSPVQKGMLFHSLYAPGSGVYVEQFSCLLPNGVDVPAFERSWQRVLDRHPALRTAFVWEDVDEPVQVVHDELPLPLVHLDWRGAARSDEEERFNFYLGEDRRRDFVLT